jgi:hypothetical protein
MIHEGQGAFTRTLHTAPQDPQEQGAEETVTFAAASPHNIKCIMDKCGPP